MKVLLLNQIPEVNNKYAISLARGIKKAGTEIIVCGIENDDISDYQDITFRGLFCCYSNNRNPLVKLANYKKSWDRVVRYCVSEKIDIVHTQWNVFSPIDYLYHKIIKSKGIHVITTIHDLLPFNSKFYDYYFHKKIYKIADAIICQASCNQLTLQRDYHISPEKIFYIPHGHYMEFMEKVDREKCIEYLKLPANRPIILFFGQIKKSKGVDVLIKAMTRVIKVHPEAYCVIAGKEWKDDFRKYQDLIHKLSMTNDIRTDIKFIPDNEIKYYYNAASIAALPYKEIYQSGVVLLAAAYEKPIVATTAGEFINVIQNGKTGILVEPDNDEQFANALIWYLEHPKQSEQMARNCKKDLMIRLSWNKISAQIIDVYNKAMRQNTINGEQR